ncbi:MAG TPA: hypothetical protein VHZ55_27090 [Bryobacteraceae bacterium]|jgi:hypothetical protein|nr:hypothetical protein [Bryobacteraceae bacterium]
MDIFTDDDTIHAQHTVAVEGLVLANGVLQIVMVERHIFGSFLLVGKGQHFARGIFLRRDRNLFW